MGQATRLAVGSCLPPSPRMPAQDPRVTALPSDDPWTRESPH